MHLSVVFPVYNEAESLSELWSQVYLSLQKLEHTWEAIFVNDGSTDESMEKLRGLAQTDQRVKVISFKRNFGQTAALSAGIKFAAGDVIVPMDSDLQHDPEDIRLMLKKIEEGYDLVSGWRKQRHDKLITRLIPSFVANKIISVVGGVPLHDYGCTMKAYRREIIKDVNLYGDMHRFIPIYTKRFGARITEMVVKHRPRKYGQTKYSLSRTSRVILDLLTVKFLNDYSTKPMYFFGGFGFLSFLCGIISFAIAVGLRFSGGPTLIETPLPLLSVFFCLVGFQLVLMGLLAEMIMRNYFESQNKSTYIIGEKINITH